MIVEFYTNGNCSLSFIGIFILTAAYLAINLTLSIVNLLRYIQFNKFYDPKILNFINVEWQYVKYQKITFL